ncbi:PfkB family carbohydrate kinase, partial [Staphylococcus capitis]|uniref:PfkB family carbohydrate kinase n=1 Tax=Staphylococcus capitis TaxID=29388 RepID=UPI0021B3D36D
RHLIHTLLPYRPLFIEPNKHQLQLIFNTTLSTHHDLVKYRKQILKKPPQSLIISLPPHAAIYVHEHQTIKAHNPQPKVINTL